MNIHSPYSEVCRASAASGDYVKFVHLAALHSSHLESGASAALDALGAKDRHWKLHVANHSRPRSQ